MRPFIMMEPNREFIQALDSQQQDGKCQDEQDAPGDKREAEPFGFF